MIKLALVGRPNVGKSALFNLICKKRYSIVDEAEGITRDRLYADADFFGKPFTVIDTGGIDPYTQGDFQDEIVAQAEVAIAEADVIIQVVDVEVGITPLDEEVSRRLLRANKRVVLAVNKVDHQGRLPDVGQFYSLGIPHVVATSATHGFQIAELLEAAFDGVVFPEEEPRDPNVIRVALIGRPNVGKSTLINHLLKEKRCVVSPIAGTTRDSIDIEVTVDSQRYILIDTAGIRRKKSEHEVVDKFAAIRTQKALERADVCVMLLDAREGMTHQEKRIARDIEKQGKGCILLFNKWDLVSGFRMEHCLKAVKEEVPFIQHCPALIVSALTGRNLDTLFPTIAGVFSQLSHRITTGELNRFIERAIQKYPPPMITGKRLRIYYMAQVASHPPHFVFFVNRPELMTDTYKKYLLNQFRTFYHFTGAPLEFSLRGKQERLAEAAPQTQ